MAHITRRVQHANSVAAFAYRWYALFDVGAPAADFATHLPDEAIEFGYPDTTYTDPAVFAKAAAEAPTSIHHLDSLAVRELHDGTTEVLCPHHYLTPTEDASTWRSAEIVARMQIRHNLRTRSDPRGEHPKIKSYRVLVAATTEVAAPETEAAHHDLLARAFVHQWWSHIDADATELLRPLVATGALDIDLFGFNATTADELVGFLDHQRRRQQWSAHEPIAIQVGATEDGHTPVRFLVRFTAGLDDGSELQVSNHTEWTLRWTGDRPALSSYRITLI